MIPVIFIVEDGEVVLNPTILLDPIFKELYEFSNHSLDYFSHMWFIHDPETAYGNLTPKQRKERADQNWPHVDYECPEYIIARDWFVKLCITPMKKIYEGAVVAADKYANFFIDNATTGTRDGTVADFKTFIKESPLLMKSMHQSEVAYKEEIIKSRGNEEMNEDDDVDYEKN